MKRQIMKIIAMVMAISICFGLNVMAGETVLYDNEYSYNVSQKEAREHFELLNKFRTGEEAWYWNEDNSTKKVCSDLKELVYDYELEKIALQRTAEIIRNFSHTRPSGDVRGSVFAEYGYETTFHGENICFGFSTSQEALNGFKEDKESFDGQGHRRNMLSDGYNRVGIGHIIYKGTHYWVQEFAYSERETQYTEPYQGVQKFVIKETKKAEKVPEVEVGATANAVVVSTLEGTVKAADGKEYRYEAAAICEYTGKKILAPVKLMDKDGYALVPGKDYKVSYKNNKNANIGCVSGNYIENGGQKAQIIIKFKKDYKKSKTASIDFRICPAKLSEAVVSAKKSTITAKEGKAVKFYKNAVYTAPENKKGKKISNKDLEGVYMINKATLKEYQVSDSGSAPAGEYIIRLTGKGNFYGENTKAVFTLVRE